MAIELGILNFIQDNMSGGFMDAIMPVISALGNASLIWLVLAGILTIGKDTRRTGVSILVSLLINVIFCNMLLKPLIARPRPFTTNPWIKILIDRPSEYSFPSGHASSSFAAAAALWVRKSKLRIPGLIVASLIAFSRLYLYVHYPTDIIAGIILGIAAGIAGSWLTEKVMSLSERRL